VAVTVTVEGEAEVLVEIPQAASSSNVKGMFLASQSEVWRWMESRYRDNFVRYDYSPTVAREAYLAGRWGHTSWPCSRSMHRGTSVDRTCMLRRWCRIHLGSY
jgi:hypothetical protein